ncbi:MAG: UDP-N-acetylmuramoylalanine/D-glutamate ligase [Verrucomicrobiales bacterium]|nr:UDP-N-acetylmuramoylalanine/D-glutamate ligase [Verrucomicrobiales bacterium]
MLATSSKYSGQCHAILGMGTSGMAAARLAQRLGAEVTLLDDGEATRLEAAARTAREEGFTVFTGPAALTGGGGFDLAVLSPGIDPSWPLARRMAEAGLPCISEIEFAARQSPVPIIAITGTNGKTTTTGLIAHLLNVSGRRTVPCGNYGRALADVVLADDPLDVLTVEVSSFQLELIDTFQPRVSVWMNFAPDHLDRHPSLKAYRAAKLRIFERQSPSDTAVINGAETYPPLAARPVTFSAWRQDTDWTYDSGVIRHHGHAVITLADTPLRGRHNAENIMAALAAVTAWGVPLKTLPPLLASFVPPPHRCEPVGTVQGREFLNDSKATNPHAMESALRGQEQPVVLIAGGKQKGLDYTPALPLIAEKTSHVFTIGEIGPALAECWASAAPCVPCASLEEAVSRAFAAAAPGQSILFAPGTSSFDMFTSYAHRGDVFRQIVQQLPTMP